MTKHNIIRDVAMTYDYSSRRIYGRAPLGRDATQDERQRIAEKAIAGMRRLRPAIPRERLAKLATRRNATRFLILGKTGWLPLTIGARSNTSEGQFKPRFRDGLSHRASLVTR